MDIVAKIEAIATAPARRDERQFVARGAALDTLEQALEGHIDVLLAAAPRQPQLLALRDAALRLRTELEVVDRRLFRRLRGAIRSGALRGPALQQEIEALVPPTAWAGAAEPGYDALDHLVNGLLGAAPPPEETVAREPEMVCYQKTPARVIVELLRRARLTRADMFVDLGSGLGQAPLLVALLSEARALGVEIEPAYNAYAQACAASLDVTTVTFVTADARAVELQPGVVCFMFTPFTGAIMQTMLDRLRQHAGPLRLFTYGPCTAVVAQAPWLRRDDGADKRPYALASFHSVPPA